MIHVKKLLMERLQGGIPAVDQGDMENIGSLPMPSFMQSRLQRA